MATSSRAFGELSPDDDDDRASDDESGDSIEEVDDDAPLSSARHSVVSDVDSIAAMTVNALQIPDTSAARCRQTRQRKRRTSAQVRRIMGWYPTPVIERTVASEQAKVESLREAISQTKSMELQQLVARLNGRVNDDANDDTNDGANDDDYDGEGRGKNEHRDTSEGRGSTPNLDQSDMVSDNQLLELARTATALERHVTALERAYRGEHVYSSASTVNFSLPSAGAFNFSPGTALPTSLASELATPAPPVEVHRVFSKQLVDLYESVGAIHVPDDDSCERDRFLERHRFARRGHASARVLQATYRMSRCRRKFLAWRHRRRQKLRIALAAWLHLRHVEGFARRNACRRVFREWADEVECTLKLRMIELKLLQQSSTKVASVSNLVKNLFLTTTDDLSTTTNDYRKAPDYSYMFVNKAFAAVQDKSKDAVTVSRIASIRAEMRTARDAVAKQYVHTLFLKWRAYHEDHKRTSVNAQLCLRRAMRVAFLRRPKWLGERVQVVFEMWARYTLFQKHKRACMDVPRFPTPLAQWDLWVIEYKARQLRKLAAHARGPIMWMTRFFRLLRAYCYLSKAKKAENRRARAYCSRRHLGLVFAKWHALTLLNLETRGSLKKALFAWQTYTAMRSDCRVPKRKMQLRTRDTRMHKAWEGWKETQSRRSILSLDRRTRLLQPSMYPRVLNALYHWAQITSQDAKSHLFHRWASRVYRRKALVKLWTEATRLHGRVLLQATFTAWRRHLAGTAADDQSLTADPVAIDALLESALPFMFVSDAHDSYGDTPADVVLSELHAFHVLVRDGQLSEVESQLLEDPRLASAREPVLGNNALHIAAQAQPKHQEWTTHRQVLRLLVQAGASPFARNLVGDSALSLVSDPDVRHYLRATGYGFHSPSQTACDTSRIDTRVLWHLLLRIGIEHHRGDRALGDADVGTWHTVDLTRPLPSTKWDPPPAEIRRRSFLYILANKLLQRPVVEAAEANAPGLLQEKYLAMHHQLLRDREIVPDSCKLECFEMPELCVDVSPVHAIMPAFHTSFYYGKDLARTTEHNLRVDLVGPLLGKRPPLDAIADQVEKLAGLARAAEAQLLQVERNNATLLPLPGAPCYGSAAEELQGVDRDVLDAMLRIYFKLQQVRMLDKASEKLPAFIALQAALPTETALLQRLDRAVDDHSRDVKKAFSVTAAAHKKLALYQNAYTSLFTTMKQAPTTAGDAVEKLVATRMQVDEALLSAHAASRQQKKKEAAQTRLETLQTIYRDLLNEQRTWTKDEFAVLDAMLVIQGSTMDALFTTFQTADGRRRALLDEITQRRPDDRLGRRNIKTTAKKLLLQLHVLHQTLAACQLLLIHDVGGRARPPSALTLTAVPITNRVDERASSTTVSPLVSQALQKHLPKRVPPPNSAIAESVLVQAYKRSMMLLFAEERRIIATDVERQDAEDAKKREVFFEASPVATMAHRTATPTDVDRMDRTRRETRLVNTPTLRRRPKAETRPNRKRLELQKARISMVSRAAASDAASSHDTEDNDDDDRHHIRSALSASDALLGEPRTIEGMQYTFGNFASRAFYDAGPSMATTETPTTDKIADDAIESIWRSHGAISSLSATTLALKTRVFESQTNAVKPVEAVAHAPLARSNSKVGRRHTTLVTQSSQSQIFDAAKMPEVQAPSVMDVVSPDLVEVTATMTLMTAPKSPETARPTAPVLPPPPSSPTPRGDDSETPTVSARSSVTEDENEEAPRTPLMLRIGMPPMTPPAPRVSISAELGLTSSDLLANLESFAIFSEALLQKQQQPKPASRIVWPPRPTLGSSASTPELDVAAPLSTASSSSEPRMRLFHELVQRDESIVKRRDPKRRWRTKRSVPRQLPALETSFSLDGRAFAALHQPPASVPAPRSPPRYIPPPSSSNNNKNEDGKDNEDDEDDEHRAHLARIELLYNPENDPGRPPLSMDPPKYTVKTLRETRPFNNPPVVDTAPALPALSNVVLCGSQLRPPPTVTPASLFPCVAPETLQQETMSNDDKSKVWAAFTAKPLPSAIQAAYAELYPGTYLTATPLRRDAITIPSSGSVPELPRPSMGGVDTAVARSLLGRKSAEICFWQAVEGFKSIRDESIRGLVLAPAKVRRKRRSIEIAHEFLTPQSPQALRWLLLEYPDVIETIERLVQGESVPATTFNELQQAVERRLATAHASNTLSDDNAPLL
ncbi:hypothetical protein SDRG_05074 [Saprolegnia diclina VS20]|uniref:RGS domain-containing protein n=1 Tax=Saprolegnia diclina (strain VS20) TaxID=1156394 RepID=T0QS26_SAPDV|nr:hypothetical protein SDRG_05074 [Saprolegnia diclina VS20]EQC37471.1 hypothetical protein SDRG_05074 [Saprolegnia diclina VS20]|eukprot:XP_008608991.1 hypothetical protein SDRG_05074 [Saprolegnia diclina VS20]